MPPLTTDFREKKWTLLASAYHGDCQNALHCTTKKGDQRHGVRTGVVQSRIMSVEQKNVLT